MVSVVFSEETMRAGKKRIRNSGAYSYQSNLMFYTARTLVPECVPEKRRPRYQVYNTGDVIGFADAMGPREVSRPLKEKILGAKAVKLTSSEETSSLAQFG